MKDKNNSSKALNIALWVAQVLLAAMFIMTGIMKLSQPIVELSTTLAWVGDSPEALVRFIGLSELLGGIGLLLPSILRIMPVLTPYAAIGLVVIQVLAAAVHIYRGEVSAIGVNIALALISTFVAWGRLKKAPIPSKN
jgi:putative oxidoreductase